MFLWLAVLAVFTLGIASPLPLVLDNSTEVNSSNSTQALDGWVSTPNVRGTYDILNSVISTLLLCAWTAYHPNVHPHRGKIARSCERAAWAFCAAFFPELVLWCAWDQWWTAKRLRKKINESSKQSRTPPTTPRVRLKSTISSSEESSIQSPGSADRHYSISSLFYSSLLALYLPSAPASPSLAPAPPNRSQTVSGKNKANVTVHDVVNEEEIEEIWSMEQAFHAVGGGLTVDSSDFWRTPSLSLTPKGLEYLHSLGYLPIISGEELADKNKADSFTKCITLIQAMWFIVACVGRLITHLSLSLLEIHAMVHVVCALTIYIFWFNKPYLVESATVIKDEEIVNLAALFIMDEFSATALTRSLSNPTCTYEEVRTAHLYGSKFGLWVRVSRGLGENNPYHQACEDPKWNRIYPPEVGDLPADHIIHQHCKRANKALVWLASRRPTDMDDETTTNTYLSHMKRRRGLVVAQRSNMTIDGNASFYSLRTRDDDEETDGAPAQRWLRRINIMAIFSILYGAGHLSAWNYDFPSLTEKWMWRAGSLAMATCMPTFGAFLLLTSLDDWLTKVKRRSTRSYVKYLINTVGTCVFTPLELLISILLIFLMTAYVFARPFVLVEAFAALRKPPLGTYTSDGWSNFFPHFG